MSLPDYGWTEEQAQGLFERLNLDGGTPNWKREHLQRLRSWCSAHGKDPATVDGQLEFVVDDLCNTYEGVGMALRRATTVREAKAAVAHRRPYADPCHSASYKLRHRLMVLMVLCRRHKVCIAPCA
jgi:hypothetical protein